MAESRFDARRWPRQSAGGSRIPAPSAGARPRTTPARRRMRPLRRLAHNVGFVALGLLAMLGGMSLSLMGSDLLPSAVDDIRTVSVTPTVSAAQAAASKFRAVRIGAAGELRRRRRHVSLLPRREDPVSPTSTRRRSPSRNARTRLGSGPKRRGASSRCSMPGRSNCAAAHAHAGSLRAQAAHRPPQRPLARRRARRRGPGASAARPQGSTRCA